MSAPRIILWIALTIWVVGIIAVTCLALYATTIDGSGLLLLPAILVAWYGLRRTCAALAYSN